MKNNDGVHGITFAEHLFVLYQYFFPHLTLQGSYTFSAVKFKDFPVPHLFFKFQGPYLQLLTQVPNKLYFKYSDNNGPFFLMANIFMKIRL